MMAVFSKAFIFEKGKFRKGDITVASAPSDNSGSCSGCYIFPGFTDVHVHFREPGFSYKETIATGSAAAARGGFTSICTMPNLSPTPDNLDNLRIQTDIIEKDAKIAVYPYGTITVGEKGERVSDIEALSPYVCGFSDDGHGVASEDIMREAMQRAKSCGKLIAAHCENPDSVKDSPEAEWREIERNIRLSHETGCALHICHISTAESVRLIRDAKSDGVDVTCETAPHYLLLSELDIRDEGGFRMNPPLRSERDRRAMLDGLCDGTIDMIATDHAPHSAEEKARGLKSLNGIVGLETAFSSLYTGLVKSNIISLARLVSLMSENPRKRFGLPESGFCVFDLDAEYTVEPRNFASLGRSTPFAGKKLFGVCRATVHNGEIVYRTK